MPPECVFWIFYGDSMRTKYIRNILIFTLIAIVAGALPANAKEYRLRVGEKILLNHTYITYTGITDDICFLVKGTVANFMKLRFNVHKPMPFFLVNDKYDRGKYNFLRCNEEEFIFEDAEDD